MVGERTASYYSRRAGRRLFAQMKNGLINWNQPAGVRGELLERGSNNFPLHDFTRTARRSLEVARGTVNYTKQRRGDFTSPNERLLPPLARPVGQSVLGPYCSLVN